MREIWCGCGVRVPAAAGLTCHACGRVQDIGQQQRVALARALIADTGLILCDEPLSNLDADLRERMRVEISALVREAGATTVYITHDQAEAFALADRVGVLEDGALVQEGTPEDVYSNPASCSWRGSPGWRASCRSA